MSMYSALKTKLGKVSNVQTGSEASNLTFIHFKLTESWPSPSILYFKRGACYKVFICWPKIYSGRVFISIINYFSKCGSVIQESILLALFQKFLLRMYNAAVSWCKAPVKIPAIPTIVWMRHLSQMWLIIE
jgi:hypothetical protein